ncbi:MAG: hypothetical protein NW208_07210 [Bryobacter sp.]|nr:hypothetical protein [Bryobacter sp.]
MLEQIEIQLEELRQAEELEAQVRAMVAAKRQRLASLLREFAGVRKQEQEAVLAAAPAPSAPEPVLEEKPLLEEKPVLQAKKDRPYGAPGAPRDLLAESGAKPASQMASKGATALLKDKNAVAKSPSAQHVFQSLNRLVGGTKDSTLKH